MGYSVRKLKASKSKVSSKTDNPLRCTHFHRKWFSSVERPCRCHRVRTLSAILPGATVGYGEAES